MQPASLGQDLQGVLWQFVPVGLEQLCRCLQNSGRLALICLHGLNRCTIDRPSVVPVVELPGAAHVAVSHGNLRRSKEKVE